MALLLVKNIVNAMTTNVTSIYRIVDMNQLNDILECGFVRPKDGKLKGGHSNEVFWSIGGDN